MKKPVVVRSQDVETTAPVGSNLEAGWMKRIIYPANVMTKRAFLGVSEVNPGFSVHRWHGHVSDKSEGYEVTYPKNFEEIYYIVSGNGVLQWKTNEGKVEEKEVSNGDAILLPVDVVEHQLLNNGSEKIFVVFCGCPPPNVIIK